MIPWAQTVREDGTFKSRDELDDLYEAKGVTPTRTSSRIAGSASGRATRGSSSTSCSATSGSATTTAPWTEWGSMVGVPIEKPAAVPVCTGRRAKSAKRLEHPGIGNQPGRIEKVRLGRHELIAVGNPEAESRAGAGGPG